MCHTQTMSEIKYYIKVLIKSFTLKFEKKSTRSKIIIVVPVFAIGTVLPLEVLYQHTINFHFQ